MLKVCWSEQFYSRYRKKEHQPKSYVQPHQTWIVHILIHYSLLIEVTNGKVGGKKIRERPREMLLDDTIDKNGNRRYKPLKDNGTMQRRLASLVY